ncbi:hypothetical protein GLA29479_4372 [Lysobacter antibioticus]|jgi:hypothetical protein|uniref:Lipoprotein n=1 Tax=Lysobacter antibioticus TaxID=84531 RepID=A0A0S2F7U5_LYSAN|nr:hypothetical protein [Lysobacter antibioticus]ALN65209.1 hypothetical protein GLA29479_4372 [Lysobacter antibioticus]ALN79621.1 hypothetical protein LA76x_1465 [Lysobacter antibioticus]
MRATAATAAGAGLLPALFCTLMFCALIASCATTPQPQASAKENAAMTTQSPTLADSARLDAEQIGKRVLKLIDSIHGAQDLSPENIEKQTGIKVEIHSEDRTEYGFGGALTNAWSYSLTSVSYRQGEKPTRLDFRFLSQAQGAVDIAPICSMDFKDYSQALTSAGFQAQTLPSGDGSDPGFGYRGAEPWSFVRGKVEVAVYIHGNQDPEQGRACISSLAISTQA